MKLSYCPFDRTKCYGLPENSLFDNTLQTVGTTISFGRKDVCPWRIKIASEY